MAKLNATAFATHPLKSRQHANVQAVSCWQQATITIQQATDSLVGQERGYAIFPAHLHTDGRVGYEKLYSPTPAQDLHHTVLQYWDLHAVIKRCQNRPVAVRTKSHYIQWEALG